VKDPGTLSREEIDALLSAVHSGSVPASPAAPAPPREVVAYNFRRPSRASKEHIRGLALLHEDLSKLASSSLSGVLRTMVDLEVAAVEQVTYAEHMLSMSSPTCAFVFKMEPLSGEAVLEVSPNLAFVMMDRLLGGSGQAVSAPRDLTEIERAVMERIGHRLMLDLAQAWQQQQLGTFQVRLLNLETNPQLVQVTAQNEVILAIAFRLKIGDVTGGITLGYPYLLVEPMLDRLGVRKRTQASAAGPTPDVRSFVLRELSQSPLGLRAVLGHASITVRDLLDLRVGQVLPLVAPSSRPVRVDLNDVPKFAGRLGTHRAHLAVEITDRLDEEIVRP
jgi:flagellar motor switch protein FliM